MRTLVVALAIATASAIASACVETPQLEPLLDDGAPFDTPAADGAPVPSNVDDGALASDAGDSATIPLDAGTVDALPPSVDGSPPPPVTCPLAGAPPGTACCGVGATAPPCIGLACNHCGDCIAVGCQVGLICCAETAGGNGKYKGMSCRAAALASTCP